jgi:hypothetical protein
VATVVGKMQTGPGGACGGVWRNLSLAGILASVAVKMFSHLIIFFKIFYKFCSFSEICKDNITINSIAVKQKMFIPVNFDGLYYATVKYYLICQSLQNLSFDPQDGTKERQVYCPIV